MENNIENLDIEHEEEIIRKRRAVKLRLEKLTNRALLSSEIKDVRKAVKKGKLYLIEGVEVNAEDYLNMLESVLKASMWRGPVMVCSTDPAVFYGRKGDPTKIEIVRGYDTY